MTGLGLFRLAAQSGLCIDTPSVSTMIADLTAAHLDRPIAVRSDSLSSNSSGLARRPRIRSRTRTLPEGSCWSDSTGALPDLRASRITETDLVAEPVQSVPPPPRPPRSPKRSIFNLDNGALDVPLPRERKISSTSTRSAKSSRGGNASLEELLALKNVCLFFFLSFFGLLKHVLAGYCWQTGSACTFCLSAAPAHDRHCQQCPWQARLR